MLNKFLDRLLPNTTVQCSLNWTKPTTYFSLGSHWFSESTGVHKRQKRKKKLVTNLPNRSIEFSLWQYKLRIKSVFFQLLQCVFLDGNHIKNYCSHICKYNLLMFYISPRLFVTISVLIFCPLLTLFLFLVSFLCAYVMSNEMMIIIHPIIQTTLLNH